MREVAELSGNFRGELSLQDRGEGARRLFFCAFFHGNAHERVQGIQAERTLECRRQSPSYENSENSTKEETGGTHERITENQNQAEGL